MKRLYISADIEGVCGIADWKETELEDSQSAYFRGEMTREVQAACEAAVEAGVGEIFVKDAHATGRNIDPAALPDNAKLMRAWTRDPWSMMAGIDASFGGAMLIGYHSGSGSNGNPLAHTMNTNNVRILINGAESSEFLMNAYSAASVGVPVILLAGDSQLCAAAKALDPRIATIPVSEGIGNASVSINPRVAVRRIKEEAAKAIRAAEGAKPIALPSSFDLVVEFRQHYMAYRGSFYPGAAIVSPLAVGFKCATWFEALTFIFWVL